MENAQPVKQSTGGWKRRFGFAAIVSAALAFTLCFFGPLDLFFNNYEELWFTLQDILPSVAVMALILFACGTLLGTLLRGKLHNIYMALMFGGLLGLYVQGSFMNKDYGTLNGTAVDWSAYTGYGVMNTIVWVVCIALPLVLMLVLKDKKMRPVLMFLSCALILMQGASLVVSYVNYPKVTESATLTTDGIYDLSKEENTIVFVVDTLDEIYWQQFISENLDYKDTLQGFTCYDNALATGARTQVAMPLLLSGLPRTMTSTYSEYIDTIWKQQTVFNDLDSAGYDTRLFTESKFVSQSAQDVVDNLEMSASSVGNSFGLIKKMYKLTLYKYSPHFLKWRFWMYTGDFDKYKADREYTLDDAKLYKNYQDNGGFTYTSENKCFRLYHLMGAHEKYTLTSAGTRKNTTTSLRRQVKGVFHILRDMLEDLQESGVYDKSNILIIGDHGDKGKCQYTACLYKPAGSTGAYTVSDAPISFLDVPATIAAIAGGDSSKVGSGLTLTDIQEGTSRVRKYYLNIGSNASCITGEYETTGHASDTDALNLVNQYEVTSAADATDYQLGTELSFAGNKATANVYCTRGFRDATNVTTHMEGRYAQMVIPIADPPEHGNLQVAMGFSSVINESHLVVSVNGETVFEDDLTKQYDKKKEIAFQVPVTALKDNQLTIDFTYTDIPEREEEKDAGTRMQTIKATTLVISVAD